jgi:protein SCO1/2
MAGCAKKEAAVVADTSTAQPAGKRYLLSGEIVKADPERTTLIVAHDEIKGFMMAMTMEFKVSKGDLAIARPGQHIRAELVLRGSDVFLENIWPDDAATQRALDAAAKALAQDTTMRGREAYREIGETLPEFTLLDQEGRAVSGSRFRGKQIVLNFIYTRCPLANMCPAATLRMASLQKAAHEAGVKNFELVTISFDPDHDTPGVLKEYAQVRGLDTSNWSFLTGPDASVRQLLAQLGVIREFEGDTIKHTLSTVLINEQGKISFRVDGSTWLAEDFLGHLKKG